MCIRDSLLERGVDAGLAVDLLGNRIADRLHEAVDERRLHGDTGGGVDAAGGDEAVFLRLQEAALPGAAPLLGLGLGEGARHAQAHLLDARFLALGVLLDQRVAADLLLSDRCGGGAVHTGRLYSTARLRPAAG